MNTKPDNWFDETLAPTRVTAPPNLAAQTMRRLQTQPERGWFPSPRQWWIPALAGAAVALVVVLGWMRWHRADTLVNVHFELHAPGARQVELVGNFNQWRSGTIRLAGPDASGHWTATIALPEGRYEYLFLVDGRQWVTDPSAAVVRPDGFGHVNAIREVTREGTML
jgi:hypothetical protein